MSRVKGGLQCAEVQVPLLKTRVKWNGLDIDTLKILPGEPSSVYSFWVGFPYSTQLHVLELCAQNSSVESLAVYRDRKWKKPEDVMDALSDATPSRTRKRCTWKLAERIPMFMYGSGEQHESWVFHKVDKEMLSIR